MRATGREPLPRADAGRVWAVVNVHERVLTAPIERCGVLLDNLASPDDRMWPTQHWPAMRLTPGLTLGAVGGHGPIRYTVAEVERGRHVRFRFTGPTGFDGGHEFWLDACGPERTRIRHVLTLSPVGRARLTWPLIFRPLHDALIEDAFDRAEAALSGSAPAPPSWTRPVRLLRWAATVLALPARRRRRPGARRS